MYRILMVVVILVGYVGSALVGATIERRFRIERARGLIGAVFLLVLVGGLSWFEWQHRSACDAACNPDIAYECRWDWVICVPNMPRSVKLEAMHGSR
jgi:hypothetical protein